MLFTDVIRSKRDGNELTAEQIEFFVRGLADQSIPAEQVSALAMAIFLRSMSVEEAGLLTVAFFALGPSLVDLLTTSEPVRSEARSNLFWAAMTALAGVVAFQMDGVFIGATWSAEMRNMMLISLAMFLATWWIAVPLIGNHGLWLALNVFLGIRGITLYWRMMSKREQEFAF